MGTITQFHLKVVLKKDVPDTIKYVFSPINNKEVDFEGWDIVCGQISDHMFFKLPRWNRLFFGSAFQNLQPSRRVNQQGYTHISLHGEMKNYDGEIEAFCEWIGPFLTGRKNRIYIGWSKHDMAFDAPQRHYWFDTKNKQLI